MLRKDEYQVDTNFKSLIFLKTFRILLGRNSGMLSLYHIILKNFYSLIKNRCLLNHYNVNTYIYTEQTTRYQIFTVIGVQTDRTSRCEVFGVVHLQTDQINRLKMFTLVHIHTITGYQVSVIISISFFRFMNTEKI